MHYLEIEELLSAMYGVTDDQRNDGFDFDELLYEEFEIGFEEFSKIIKALLPLTPMVESAITGKKYHAFIKDGRTLVKQEAE